MRPRGFVRFVVVFAVLLGWLCGASLGSGPLPGGGSLPAGSILMWAGTLASVPPDYQLCDGTNGTPNLLNSFVKCVSAAENPGVTGGAASASYTPAGSNSVPTFTGSALGTHSHGVGTYAAADHTYTPQGTNGTANFTPAGSNSAPAFTGSSGTVPAETISWPAGVPTLSSTTGAGTNTPVPFNITAANDITGITGGIGLTLTTTPGCSGFNGTTLVAGSNSVTVPGSTFAGTPHTHTASWPAGVPTNASTSFTPSGTVAAPAFTGSSGTVPAETFAGTLATLTHSLSGSSAAVGAGTPAGTVTAPAFTGQAATIATEPVFYKVAFIIKVR